MPIEYKYPCALIRPRNVYAWQQKKRTKHLLFGVSLFWVRTNLDLEITRDRRQLFVTSGLLKSWNASQRRRKSLHVARNKGASRMERGARGNCSNCKRISRSSHQRDFVSLTQHFFLSFSSIIENNENRVLRDDDTTHKSGRNRDSTP